MKKQKNTEVDKNDYSEEIVRAKRSFPKRNIVFLSILVVLQVVFVLVGVLYVETPDDIIEQYNVTVTPRADGSLDILYDVTWKAISATEALTWVEIGIPNPNATVYGYTVSDNVEDAEVLSYKDGTSYVCIDFTEEYIDGDVVHFSFEINQKDMLTVNKNGYFYELVPGWFNAIPVESYRFRWSAEGADLVPDDAIFEDGYYVFGGALDPGGYKLMQIGYSDSRFYDSVPTVQYKAFDPSGARNELEEDKTVLLLALLFAAIMIIPEVYIIDSFVSYGRGRGFITEHGHPVHTYGRQNPAYVAAVHASGRYSSGYHPHGSRGGGSGGGCACACACACAGGGRAGCSQKDGVSFRKRV